MITDTYFTLFRVNQSKKELLMKVGGWEDIDKIRKGYKEGLLLVFGNGGYRGMRMAIPLR